MKFSIRLLLLPLFIAVGMLSAPPASAQLDPGDRLRLVQGGLEYGQVLVPPDQDLCHYVEYWFLYEGFESVSVRSRARFTVTVTGKAGDLKGFLAEMWKAHPKGRLLTATSTETRDGCP